MWLSKFQRVCEEIQSHPDLELFEPEFGEPSPSELLDAASEEFGQQLPVGVREFYEQMNGVMFDWYDKNSDIGGRVLIEPVERCFRKAWLTMEHHGQPGWMVWPFNHTTEDNYVGFRPGDSRLFVVAAPTGDERELRVDFSEYLRDLLRMRGLSFWEDRYYFGQREAVEAQVDSVFGPHFD